MRIQGNLSTPATPRERELTSPSPRARGIESSPALQNKAPSHNTVLPDSNSLGLAPDEIELLEAVRAIRQKYEGAADYSQENDGTNRNDSIEAARQDEYNKEGHLPGNTTSSDYSPSATSNSITQTAPLLTTVIDAPRPSDRASNLPLSSPTHTGISKFLAVEAMADYAPLLSNTKSLDLYA